MCDSTIWNICNHFVTEITFLYILVYFMLPCTACLVLESFTQASCFKPKPVPTDDDEVGTYFVQLVGTFAILIHFIFVCFYVVCNMLPTIRLMLPC
jgi:hypothetical protein